MRLPFRTAITLVSAASSLLAATPLGSSLLALRRGDPNVLEEIKPGSPVDDFVWEANAPTNLPWRQGLLAGEWLFRAHLLRQKAGISDLPNRNALERSWLFLALAETRSRTTYTQFQTPGQMMHMNRVLTDPMASGRGISGQERETLHLLRLEVSTRLGDPEKMRSAMSTFKEVVDYLPGFAPNARTQYLAMLTALHSGNWPFAERMAKGLNDPAIARQLHAQAAQDPSVPDYAAALAWVAEAKPEAESGRIQKASFRIKQFRLREAGAEWRTESVAHPLHQPGALAHWLRDGPSALPFAGHLGKNRMRMMGLREEAGGRHTEWLELTRISGGTWKGALTIRPAAGQPRTLEAEFELEPILP